LIVDQYEKLKLNLKIFEFKQKRKEKKHDLPFIDIPTSMHFRNLHALQVIFDVERIGQLLFSAQ